MFQRHERLKLKRFINFFFKQLISSSLKLCKIDLFLFFNVTSMSQRAQMLIRVVIQKGGKVVRVSEV